MIDNRLRACCENCYDINLKCGTDETVKKSVLGDLERKIYSFIACKHEQVCKKYNEEQEPVYKNGMLVFKDANGNMIRTGEDLQRSTPARLDIAPCDFASCCFCYEGNCYGKEMYKECVYRKLKRKEIEERKSSIKNNATP